MHKQSQNAEDEVSRVIDQLRVQEYLSQRLVERAHVAHDAY